MMKNKYYILIYVAAILGGVLGAYLLARNSIWGLIFAAFCAMFIIERSVNSWDTAMAKREQKKAAAKKELEEKRRLELEEKEQNGYRYMEVRVYAAGAKRLVCSLVTSVS